MEIGFVLGMTILSIAGTADRAGRIPVTALIRNDQGESDGQA